MPTPIIGLQKVFQTSASNTDLTISTPTGSPIRIMHVIVKYSGAPTGSPVTCSINPAEGSQYNTIIASGTSATQNFFFIPDEKLTIMKNDQFVVLAPAGGTGITASVQIYWTYSAL